MIIVRYVVNQFLQIAILDDRAEKFPQCAQLRFGENHFGDLAYFIERKVEEAQWLRDNYHTNDECKQKYFDGDVDSFIKCNPIVLVTDTAFLSFKLIIGDDCLSNLCADDLL